jgi:hypothetical protein
MFSISHLSVIAAFIPAIHGPAHGITVTKLPCLTYRMQSRRVTVIRVTVILEQIRVAMVAFRDREYQLNKLLRTIIFVMAALYSAAILWISFMLAKEMLWSAPSIASAIAWKVFIICALPYILCVVPAVVLAILNQRLPLALMACIVAIPLGAAIGFSIA